MTKAVNIAEQPMSKVRKTIADKTALKTQHNDEQKQSKTQRKSSKTRMSAAFEHWLRPRLQDSKDV